MRLPAFLASLDRSMLRPQEIEIPSDEFRPMTELDYFISKTRSIVDGLDQKIEDLDAEISAKIAQLNDLRHIRKAQAVALSVMESDNRE